MPIYEYACLKCGRITEAMQKFSDAPLTTCPECQGQLKKLISNTSFVLKGSGWYVTDYARKDSATAKKNTESKTGKAAADTKTDSSSEGKKETKTEAKKETTTTS